MKPQELEDRLINFAVMVIGVVEVLPNSKAGNHIAGQLVRSGTSPAPNYGEARSAESRKDFIHKMKISLKELRESVIWLIPFAKINCRNLGAFRPVGTVHTSQGWNPWKNRDNPSRPEGTLHGRRLRGI